MKIKLYKQFLKYKPTKHYIKIELTMEEGQYLRDYIENKIEDSAAGKLKSLLEEKLK